MQKQLQGSLPPIPQMLSLEFGRQWTSLPHSPPARQSVWMLVLAPAPAPLYIC